jgi:hypothetical protein
MALNDPLSDAKRHTSTRISESDHRVALLNFTNRSQPQIRKLAAFDFKKPDVAPIPRLKHLRRKLTTIPERRQHHLFIVNHVSSGGYHARFRDQESASPRPCAPFS